MTVPDPYDRTVFRDGRLLDYATCAFLVDCEITLGYRVTLVQGIGGAAASGGTHLEGRAFDLAPWDGDRKERVGRKKGGAVWVRAALLGVWGEHVHGINIFDSRTNERGISPSGFAQVGKYDRGEDGLAGSRTDPDPFRPSPRVNFTRERYDFIMKNYGLDGVKDLQPTRITKVRDALVEEDHDIGKIISMMRPLGDDFKDEIKVLQKDRTRIRGLLTRMPKR